MMEGRSFEPARRVAKHCDALLEKKAVPMDMAECFNRFGVKLARAVEPRFAKLLDARKLSVSLVESQRVEPDALAETLGENCHFARFALARKGIGAVLVAELHSLLGEFDRMLGGDGKADPEVTSLPASADRFARQVEGEALASVVEASDGANFLAGARGSDWQETVPNSEETAVWIATLEIGRPDLPEWSLRFVTCETTLAQFANDSGAPQGRTRSFGEWPLEASPVASIQLPLRATLVDMPLRLSKVASLLEVGAMLPVAVNRSVPVAIDEKTIAHGTVGAMEDRVALEITHSAFSAPARTAAA